MTIVLSELRIAARRWRRSPVALGVSLISFTVGIAACIATTALFDALLLRPLPIRDAGRLVKVVSQKRDAVFSSTVWELFRDYQQVFDRVAAVAPETLILSIEGESRPISGLYVSGNALDLLGVETAIGRRLNESDERAGLVCLVSYAFWQREFAGEGSALGKSVLINGQAFQIVGVTTARFFGVEVGRQVDIVLPIPSANAAIPGSRPATAAWLHIIGRLNDEQSLATAGVGLRAWQPTLRTIAGEASSTNLREPLDTTRFDRGVSSLRDDFGLALSLLVVAAFALLLIACGNVAAVKMASLVDERPAFAIRRAIGASRRQLFLAGSVDLLMLGLAGALAGTLLATWGIRAVVPLLATPLDRGVTPYLSIHLDARLTGIVLTTFLISAACMAGVSGLAVSRGQVSAVQPRGAQAGGRLVGGLVSMILILQIALAVTLLATTGLLIRSFVELTGQATAIDDDGVVLASLNGLRFDPEPASTMERVQELLDGIRAVPGIEAASASTLTPLSGLIMLHRIEIPGAQPLDTRDLSASVNRVTSEFFSVFGTKLVVGRPFTDHDGPRARRVAVVNSSFAERYFGVGSSVGRIIKLNDVPVEIVGVVESGKYMRLHEPAMRFIYVPLAQWIGPQPQPIRLAARGVNVDTLRKAILQIVRRHDPAITVEFRTLTDEIAMGANRERLMALVATTFGGFAVAVAAAGLYGSFSYSVTRRAREFGVRAALGASPSNLFTLIWRKAGLLLGCGAILGAMGLVATSGLINSVLFGVEASDSFNLLVTAALIVTVGAAATYLPARRAANSDPSAQLRQTTD